MVSTISRRFFGVFALMAAMALMLMLPSLAKANPSNDNFADAQAISGQSASVSGTNIGATTEVGEFSYGSSSRSVWYRWTAPITGPVTMDTCIYNFDTVLSVHTGNTLDSLKLVAVNNDGYAYKSGCFSGSFVQFDGTAGTTYYIRVVGDGGSQGNFTLNLKQVSPPPPPPNDNFADAQAVSGYSASVNGTNVGATTEVGEPTINTFFPSSRSVWYRWTAPASGSTSINIPTTACFEALSVYTGSTLGSLTQVAANGGVSSNGCTVNFNGTAGTTYYIRVAGYNADQGNFTLNLQQTPPPPPNDNFANAQTISGQLVSVTGTTAGGTREFGEPDHYTSNPADAGQWLGDHTVWYRWTAPVSGSTFIDTCTTNIDSILAVYTGDSLFALSRVADNNDGSCGGGGGSKVTFKATAGTTYQIVVGDAGSLNLRQNTFTLKLDMAPIISGMPSDITKVATSSSGAQVSWQAPTATDTVDGDVNVECSPASGSNFPLGSTTVTCTAQDAAGNKATETFNVNVTYSWSGLLQPINGGSTLGDLSDDTSLFKQGSTIPLKFKPTGDSAGITDASARIVLVQLDGSPDGTELEATSTNAPDSGGYFRYDSTSAQYIYNLGTKGLAAGDYLIKIDLGDGTTATNTVRFSLKK